MWLLFNTVQANIYSRILERGMYKLFGGIVIIMVIIVFALIVNKIVSIIKSKFRKRY